MNTDQIKHMVDRFLAWRLPSDFSPDGGISYAKMDYHAVLGPTGTNLLDATQADAMVRHMVDGLPATNSHATLTAALEEVRGALEVFKTMAEAQRKKAGDAYGYGCMGVVYADSDIKRCDAALATIDAALGRVEG